jgi:hypothetical protein
MGTLYHNNNTFVSTEVVEFDGKKYNPKELLKVFVLSHEEYGGIFKGGGLALLGIILLSSGVTTIGAIVLLIGGIWCGSTIYNNQEERVYYTVSPSFSGGRHTGDPDSFTVHLKGKTEAKKLEKALWQAKEG